MKPSTRGLRVPSVLVLALPGRLRPNRSSSRTDYPVDDCLTPTDNPCLVETIHATGTFEERLPVVINPGGGYSWQVKPTTKNMVAVGLTTVETYQYNGPLSYIEN